MSIQMKYNIYLNAEDVKIFSGAGIVSVWKNGFEEEACAGSIIWTLGSTSAVVVRAMLLVNVLVTVMKRVLFLTPSSSKSKL